MSTTGQFRGAIKSIQRGTITITAAASNTATVTAVNTAKSELRFLGGSGVDNSTGTVALIPRLVLTNSTTITATTIQTASTAVVSWELTEYY